MDGLECIMLKQNKSVRERQIYDFTHVWNLRNKTDEHTGGGKNKEGNKPQETLRDREQTDGGWREMGGGWARW